MKESRMIEEMSRFEYWRDIEWRNGRAYGNNAATWSKCVPDYLHDHNAVQRVIDGFDDLTADDYMYKLDTLINGIGLWAGSVANAKLARATCHQKVEAILKATGLWQPEETP
jgi:hypothetical protein